MQADKTGRRNLKKEKEKRRRYPDREYLLLSSMSTKIKLDFAGALHWYHADPLPRSHASLPLLAEHSSPDTSVCSDPGAVQGKGASGVT